MSDHTPFLTIFPGCADLRDSCGGLDRAFVTDVRVSVPERSLTISARFPSMPSPADLNALRRRLQDDYALSRVELNPDYPAPVSSAPDALNQAASASHGDVLMGRAIRQSPVKMETLTLESGRVTVEGDVFAVSSRELSKRGAAILSFDITDRTNSIRVTRYLRAEDDQSILGRVNVGDHLLIQGEVNYSKFDDDMVLDPRNIMKAKKQLRPDRAAPEDKRVELHLHTRFSAMDALTDPKAVVKRAAAWGMPAIAVTDHGVAQAFPDMWKAGKDAGVKIIYGLEAYYYNDMDGNSAVIGKSDLPLDTEFVAFDIETTGLNAQLDRMTEIGAVIFRGGEILSTFNTFVNLGIPIPADITELTGITDADVAEAPDEATALRAFLAYVGDRPLVAHNAHFDVGFMRATARRCGLHFDPVFLERHGDGALVVHWLASHPSPDKRCSRSVYAVRLLSSCGARRLSDTQRIGIKRGEWVFPLSLLRICFFALLRASAPCGWRLYKFLSAAVPGGDGVGGRGDGTAHDDEVAAKLFRLRRRSDALLVTFIPLGEPYPRRDGEEARAAGLMHLPRLKRGADHAVKSGCRGVAGVGDDDLVDGPWDEELLLHALLVRAGQLRHRDQQRPASVRPGQALQRRLHHGPGARGVQVHDVRPKAGEHAHGLLHGVRDVVQLQVQKHPVPARFELPDDLRSGGVIELHPDLDEGPLVPELLKKGHGLLC